jgi:virginiamycin B lyase
MKATNRTFARRFRSALLLGALLAGTLLSAHNATAAKPAPAIEGAWTATFPERVHGTSVAVAPNGVPWFGISVDGGGPSLAHANSAKLAIEALGRGGGFGETTALEFDPQGALWFAESSEAEQGIARRDPDGTVKKFALPQGDAVNALALGPEGDVWFVRGAYGDKDEARVGRVTTAGAVSQFPLGAGARPTSITVGPDGALWFTEELKGKVGRITANGEIQLFDLGPKVQPTQIVAGPDGALWFGENGQSRRYGRISDRIGRITTEGQVTQFPVPFGTDTTRLAADRRNGVVWFATEGGGFSSISPSGNVGARGCVGSCGEPIRGLALAPDGSLWFAAANEFCLMCGGGSDLIAEQFGTKIGQIPNGALTPADPDGPPAVDPYANLTDHPPRPIARTEKPREVEPNFAVFNGYINSRGYPTTWQFRWGKTRRYGHLTFLPEYPFGAEEGAARVSEEIIGLCPGTTYHYKLVAYGSGGRAHGGDQSFRTPRAKYVPNRCRR